jgi:hypothetical protein
LLIPQIRTQKRVTPPIELDDIRRKVLRISLPKKPLRSILRIHSCDVAVRIPINLLHSLALPHKVVMVALVDADGIDPKISQPNASGDFHSMTERQCKFGVRYVDTPAELLVVLVGQLEAVTHRDAPHVAEGGIRALDAFILGVSDKTNFWLLDSADVQEASRDEQCFTRRLTSTRLVTCHERALCMFGAVVACV